MHIAYLDEFGHIGPFIGREDPHHNTSPIFGLAGMVLPSDKVRSFATWFYQLKCHLLEFEIRRSGLPAYRWEKKGAALFTTKNILTYAELRQATFRLMNKIEREGGMVFYVGLQKTSLPQNHDPKALYRAVLRESIKRLEQFCTNQDAHFMMILDEQDGEDFRLQIVEEASMQMFGSTRTAMLEPPIQAESHLFQTLQCADWLCGLIGRIGCYQAHPEQYPELEWTERYFLHRMRRVAPISGIRLERPHSRLSEGGAT